MAAVALGLGSGVVTFRVDEVAPAEDLLPARGVGELFSDALVFGGDPGLPVLENDGVQPLLSAVGRAFAGHRPLVLSPDAVWLTIMQGLAQHVRLNVEELRPRLVGHAGKKRLSVVVDGAMPTDAESWQGVVEQFGKLLLAEIDSDVAFECDFSTSTRVEQMAGRVVLLDVYSPYFALWVTCVCGIPSITLTGTVEDWQKIRERVDAIAAFGLETWCRSLRPIADQFVRAAAGEVDVAFWQRIYNPVDAYGSEVITGWAARFYPYLSDGSEARQPNPLLELPIDEPRGVPATDGLYRGPGVRSDAVPATLSRVIVNVNDQVSGKNRAVALHAGLVGVSQDDDGALRPVAGWSLAPAAAEIEDVVDRIVREHDTGPAEDQRGFYVPAELVALYRRIGWATLFGGAWRLLPPDGHRRVWREEDRCSIETIIDLADGRSVAAALDVAAETAHWIVCRVEEAAAPPGFRLVDDPADVPVYGTSLAMLLDAALDSGGDISHLEIGRLDRLDDTIRRPGSR
ncbi:DUF4419 domain-containing protein [Actinomadura latina]|uniref:DUF4419 domain-containing protein n=1 Tax=Actinomadura latina TaxID=163603 RepID=A0A846ZDZ7_9ACTN|nr:DUF4419 domain-containing protein [Actinomadura latina]NKZ08196.1 DUF4419 domain-containing protein [Actinomadura latina]